MHQTWYTTIAQRWFRLRPVILPPSRHKLRFCFIVFDVRKTAMTSLDPIDGSRRSDKHNFIKCVRGGDLCRNPRRSKNVYLIIIIIIIILTISLSLFFLLFFFTFNHLPRKNCTKIEPLWKHTTTVTFHWLINKRWDKVAGWILIAIQVCVEECLMNRWWIKMSIVWK